MTILSRHCVRDWTRARDRARNRRLAGDLAGASIRHLARARAFDLSFDLACRIERAQAEVTDLAGDLTSEVGFVRALLRARSLVSTFSAIARSSVLTHAVGTNWDALLAGHTDRNRDFQRAVTAAQLEVGRLVEVLERLLQAATPENAIRSVARPVRAARGLAHAAARVLPTAHQGRYREEYHSELYELAAAKAPRWAQLLYAVRLIDRAWVLRAELRAPAAEQARP